MFIERGQILPENRYDLKNEFSMLEAESFFPNNLNHANSNGKQKKTV